MKTTRTNYTIEYHSDRFTEPRREVVEEVLRGERARVSRQQHVPPQSRDVLAELDVLGEVAQHGAVDERDLPPERRVQAAIEGELEEDAVTAIRGRRPLATLLRGGGGENVVERRRG